MNSCAVRVGRWGGCFLLFTVGFAYVLPLAVGFWIVHRYGRIPFWMIVSNMFESPSALPVRDLLLLSCAVLSALVTGSLVAVSGLVLARILTRRFGLTVTACVAVLAAAVLASCGLRVFDKLDQWFAIRHEIACRRVKSDYFAKNFHRVDPASVIFGERRRNLLVIVSESLEERFVEGAVAGENLLSGLVEWRNGGFHADQQCQIAGASFTAAALTSIFYGIPRLRLDGSILFQDSRHYPRFSVPSIWDVFLSHGYAGAYVHGGKWEFASTGRLFPESGDLRLLGFDDMCDDPDYLAEPVKEQYGVNDEVMFKYLKRETERLLDGEKPFALVCSTINPHCPEGWCSAFAPRGNRGILAESILAQDRMICDFLRWFESQPRAKDTVIVVVGDHFYWGRTFYGQTPRRVFNAVRVPGATESPFVRSRRFATFDWAPTLIELAGGRLPGDGRFGMGVSLLRDTKTLLEDIFEADFDDQMQSSLSDYWDLVLEKHSGLDDF